MPHIYKKISTILEKSILWGFSFIGMYISYGQNWKFRVKYSSNISKLGVRIIRGNMAILTFWGQKSGCVLYAGAYYTRKITVLMKCTFILLIFYFKIAFIWDALSFGQYILTDVTIFKTAKLDFWNFNTCIRYKPATLTIVTTRVTNG